MNDHFVANAVTGGKQPLHPLKGSVGVTRHHAKAPRPVVGTEERLIDEAQKGNATDVEDALGKLIDTLGPAAAAEKAKRAIAAALQKERWAVVAYLADFVSDVLEISGGEAETDEPQRQPVPSLEPIQWEQLLVCCSSAARLVRDDCQDGGGDPAASGPDEPACGIASLITAKAEPTQGAAQITFETSSPGGNVNLADPGPAIAAMKDRLAVVIDKPSIRVMLDFPLSGQWVFDLKPPGGGPNFTKEELVRAIASKYAEIYAEEERSSGIKPGYIPGMPNRNKTNGKYGIWGHVLSDLDLCAVQYDEESGTYKLVIDT